MGMLAAWTLGPVYGTSQFILAAVLAVVTGVALGTLSGWLKWPIWLSVVSAFGAYLVGVLLTAMPTSVLDMGMLVANLRYALIGPVAGWRGMVTLPVPLGSYLGVMVPAYALLFVGPLLSSVVTLRARRWWFGPVISAAVLVVAIIVGPSSPARLGSIAGYSVTSQLVIGVSAFAALLGWFRAHAALARRRVRNEAQDAPGRVTRRVTSVVVAVAMVAGATVAAVGIVSVLPNNPRTVARAQADVVIAVSSAQTPLDYYRSFFTDAMFNEPLFAVDTNAVDGRVRLAVLDTFDGESFRPGASAGDFRRLAAGVQLPPNAVGVTAEVTITGLTGIWTPSVGEISKVAFGGDRASELVDGFYFIPDSGSAVTVVDGSVAAGDVFKLTSGVVDAGTLDGQRSSNASFDRALIPNSLKDWVEAQKVGSDGTGLLELISRLRARGYLSHAIAPPTEGQYEWQKALGDHNFVSASAGNSYARVSAMFDQLNDRADEVGEKASNELLVSAVGDDEQFAAASALLARYLGFDARVVVGARLTESDPAGWAPDPCEGGVCTGRNMSAWIEVKTSNGWVTVDTSPQDENPLAPEVTNQSDPEFPSDISQDDAGVTEPPQSERSQSGSESTETGTDTKTVTRLPLQVRAIVASGLVLLALILPLIVLLAAKALRTRRRRTGTSATSAQGAWEDLLDRAADAGGAPPTYTTRQEAAAYLRTTNAAAIATIADRATYDPNGVSDDEAAVAWQMERDDSRELRSRLRFFGRLRARLSLRYLLRGTVRDVPEAKGFRRAHDATWRNDDSVVLERAHKNTQSRRKKVRR